MKISFPVDHQLVLSFYVVFSCISAFFILCNSSIHTHVVYIIDKIWYDLSITFSLYIEGFQFLDLYLTNQILSSSIMTSSFVWNRILFLCPFHKILVSWVKVSWGFCKRDKQQLRVTMYCHWRGLRINLWRKSICNISLVPENKDKPHVFIGEERGWCFAFTR